MRWRDRYYKKIRNEFSGILTGKGMEYGGSLIRPEATGYGLVYFTREMLKTRGLSFLNMKVIVSGSGNVAQFATEKVLDMGGIPVCDLDVRSDGRACGVLTGRVAGGGR